jgi:beta-glucosidase
VLFGDRDPGGRLPITFPKQLADLPTQTPEQYPGVDGIVHYSEGLEVGYRSYQARGVDPLFPFGYGLSYTTFSFAQLEAPRVVREGDDVAVRVRVRNTGTRSGSTVAQAYVAYPSRDGEPPLQLRGFEKVHLRPGRARTVTLRLGPRAFAHWDTTDGSWRTTAGTYRLLVGSSSAETPLTAKIRIKTNQKK